jgi:hypothetical protein
VKEMRQEDEAFRDLVARWHRVTPDRGKDHGVGAELSPNYLFKLGDKRDR